AGYLPVQRYGRQQHRLWPAGAFATGDPARRGNRARPRIHHAASGGLRHGDWRPRHQVERRPAAAHCDCTGAAEECADPHLGRGHFAPRHRIRDAGPKSPGEPNGTPHRNCDRAPVEHHPQGRQDRGSRARPDSRNRYTRGTGEPRRHLPTPARPAICGRGSPGPVSVRSMTGFARITRQLPEGELVFSIKSVNHRGLDVHFHVPPEMEELETDLRGILKTGVARGHLQVNIAFARTKSASPARVNRELLDAYVAAFREAAAQYGNPGVLDLNAALSIPGMLGGARESELDECVT